MPKQIPIVLDLEVSIKNKIGKNKGSAFCPDNNLVMAATNHVVDDKHAGVFVYSSRAVEEIADILSTDLTQVSPIIGQNFCFDLHWCGRVSEREEGKPLVPLDKTVWDTQLVEYLLSGQQMKYASLDYLSTMYGGTLKDDKIKKMWDAGIDTNDIDIDLLTEYAKADVVNTGIVYEGQVAAMPESLKDLVRVQNDALLAIQEMEYNGMQIDLKAIAELDEELEEQIAACELVLEETLRSVFPTGTLSTLNPSSNKVWSAFFYGTSLKQKERKVVGKFKNGKPKYKTTDEELKAAMPCNNKPTPLNGHGYCTMDEKALQSIGGLTAERILEYRKLSKLHGTYVKGLTKLIHPDGKVHPNINMTATNTGRLSETEPNGQNMPSAKDSPIKGLFVSRWEGGRIIEADYKQLEIIVLAYLSQDEQLMDDIRSGKDLHYETGKMAGVWSDLAGMDDEKRRHVKGINFGLIYGGTANGLAKQMGLDKKMVKRVMDSFYKRYPDVKTWQDQVAAEVLASRVVPRDSFTKGGVSAGVGFIISPTGRRYVFNEYDAPDWLVASQGIRTQFSPTEMKNYMVQGTATGDIVPMMLGKMRRCIHEIGNGVSTTIKMINTVHDSILFDVHPAHTCTAVEALIKGELEKAPKYFNEEFPNAPKFDLPLLVDISVGPTWKDCKPLDL